MEVNWNNNMHSWRIHQKSCGKMSKTTIEAWMHVPTWVVGLQIWLAIIYDQKVRRLKGLNYCWASELSIVCNVQKLDPHQLDKLMEGLRNNMRWKYIFRNQPDNSDYLPELYITSERNPDKASSEIEACMNEFQRQVRNESGRCSRKYAWPNLTPMQSSLNLRNSVKRKYTY